MAKPAWELAGDIEKIAEATDQDVSVMYSRQSKLFTVRISDAWGDLDIFPNSTSLESAVATALDRVNQRKAK